MIRTLRTPSAAAPSRSACKPRRLRSRVVSCMIGSTPASLTRWAAASGERWTWAPVLSVQLTASACPRSAAARFRVTAGSGLSIADSSAVTTKWPCRRRAESRLGALRIRRLGDPAPGSPPIAARGQVDPGRAALQPPVDRWVEVVCVIAPQRHPARALPGLDPDAGPVGEDLAGAVGANAAAGPVAQVLGAAHGAAESGRVEDALAAHPAIPDGFLERSYDRDHRTLQQVHGLIPCAASGRSARPPGSAPRIPWLAPRPRSPSPSGWPWRRRARSGRRRPAWRSPR